MKPLFSPCDLAGLRLPNRCVMAPMTRSRAANGVPDILTERYYSQRASAGLLISEGIAVSQQGTGYLFTPGLFSEDQGEAWARVTNAVHAEGGRIAPSCGTSAATPMCGCQKTGARPCRRWHAARQPFIANPDLVERMANGWPLAPVQRETLYGLHGARGYTDYPRHADAAGVASASKRASAGIGRGCSTLPT